ncbi:MAG TPA: hypothetical protein HPP57_06970 [Deltaproteobacteria bacterium]|jgi:hypothetical protein|nr:hypothetical protein [Deltaproteobacteria bacterium]
MEKRSYERAFEKTWLTYRDWGNYKTDPELAGAIQRPGFSCPRVFGL